MSKFLEKKSEQILIKVTPSTFKSLSEIAGREDRAVGYVARELMLRGLSLFRRDGNLRYDQVLLDAMQEGINRAIPADIGIPATEFHLAPVAATISPGDDVVEKRRLRLVCRGG